MKEGVYTKLQYGIDRTEWPEGLENLVNDLQTKYLRAAGNPAETREKFARTTENVERFTNSWLGRNVRSLSGMMAKQYSIKTKDLELVDTKFIDTTINTSNAGELIVQQSYFASTKRKRADNARWLLPKGEGAKVTSIQIPTKDPEHLNEKGELIKLGFEVDDININQYRPIFTTTMRFKPEFTPEDAMRSFNLISMEVEHHPNLKQKPKPAQQQSSGGWFGLGGAREESKAEYTLLREEFEEALKQREHTVDSLESLNREYHALLEQHKNLKLEHDNLVQIRQKLSKDYGALGKQSDETKKSLKAIEVELKGTSDLLLAEQEKTVQLYANVNKLTESNLGLTDQIAQLEQSIEKLNKENKDLETKVDQAREVHETALKQEKAGRVKELEQVNHDHAEALKQANHEHAEDVKQINKDHRAELQKEQNKHGKAIDALRETLTKEQEAHGADKELLIAANAKMEGLETNLQREREIVKELQKQLEDAVRAKIAAETYATSHVETLKAGHAEIVTKLKQVHDDALTQKDVAYKELQQHYDKAAKSLKKQHAGEIERLQKQRDGERDLLIERYKAALSDKDGVIAQHERATHNVRASFQNRLSQLEGEIDRLKSAFGELKKNAREALEASHKLYADTFEKMQAVIHRNALYDTMYAVFKPLKTLWYKARKQAPAAIEVPQTFALPEALQVNVEDVLKNPEVTQQVEKNVAMLGKKPEFVEGDQDVFVYKKTSLTDKNLGGFLEMYNTNARKEDTTAPNIDISLISTPGKGAVSSRKPSVG